MKVQQKILDAYESGRELYICAGIAAVFYTAVVAFYWACQLFGLDWADDLDLIGLHTIIAGVGYIVLILELFILEDD